MSPHAEGDTAAETAVAFLGHAIIPSTANPLPVDTTGRLEMAVTVATYVLPRCLLPRPGHHGAPAAKTTVVLTRDTVAALPAAFVATVATLIFRFLVELATLLAAPKTGFVTSGQDETAPPVTSCAEEARRVACSALPRHTPKLGLVPVLPPLVIEVGFAATGGLVRPLEAAAPFTTSRVESARVDVGSATPLTRARPLAVTGLPSVGAVAPASGATKTVSLERKLTKVKAVGRPATALAKARMAVAALVEPGAAFGLATPAPLVEMTSSTVASPFPEGSLEATLGPSRPKTYSPTAPETLQKLGKIASSCLQAKMALAR